MGLIPKPSGPSEGPESASPPDQVELDRLAAERLREEKRRHRRAAVTSLLVADGMGGLRSPWQSPYWK
jgi:hypothetical protein